jgi:hypothetical protein
MKRLFKVFLRANALIKEFLLYLQHINIFAKLLKVKILEAFALNLESKTGNFKQRDDKQGCSRPGRELLTYRCKVYQYPDSLSGATPFFDETGFYSTSFSK